jgi:hypothetical protein
MNYLPELPALQTGFRKGRNVKEGYQRGWGMRAFGVKEKIAADPLYVEALEVARDRTIVTEDNRMNLYLIMRFFLGAIPFGHMIEYGAYRGGNAIFMAYVARALYPGMKVFALDTYEGMPPTDKTVDAHDPGAFGDVDFEALQQRIAELGLDNLLLVKGLFEHTNADAMRHGPFALAHIDCDIYLAVRTSYEGVRPHMVEGGYIVFDDATLSSCIGATEFVEEALIRRDGLHCEQIWPHFVFRAQGATHTSMTTGPRVELP